MTYERLPEGPRPETWHAETVEDFPDQLKRRPSTMDPFAEMNFVTQAAGTASEGGRHSYAARLAVLLLGGSVLSGVLISAWQALR
jgi:hypothetical protein